MDRARRAEPYSNATVWTREIARNLAGHLDRLSKVHSCVDTTSPKSSHLPQFKHTPLKRSGQVSPIKHAQISAQKTDQDDEERESPLEIQVDEAERCSRAQLLSREDGEAPPSTSSVKRNRSKQAKNIKSVSKRTQLEIDRQESIAHENQRLQDRIAKIEDSRHKQDGGGTYENVPATTAAKKGSHQDYHRRQKEQRIWEENQALAKRLRNTKPTLSSKDWEKDDKWNQHFLKTHERRRQALQNEMMRTLTSPHSALIRVKHVAPGLRRQHGEPVSEDEGGPHTADGHATVLQVTAGDAGSAEVTVRSVRDLRRRRSSGDSGDLRRQATAANHRRIMELRKLREQNDTLDEGRAGRTEGNNGKGPPDELVRVRFTFSRERNRGGVCTPNGITGQFSPAVELEAELEAAIAAEEDLALDVPELQEPTSSRLESDEEDSNALVFTVLQECINKVADVIESSQGNVEIPTEDAAAAITDEAQSMCVDVIVVVDAERSVAEAVAGSDSTTFSREVPCSEPEPRDPPPDSLPLEQQEAEQEDVALYTQEIAEEPPLRTIAELADTHGLTDPPSPPANDSSDTNDGNGLETSGYGSEFDLEDDAKIDSKALHEPTLPPAPEEGDDENKYEDDEEAEEENPVLDVGDLADREPEAQYENDLEPGGDAEDAEDGWYSDDGFTDD